MGKGEGRMKRNLRILTFGLLILFFVIVSASLGAGLFLYYNPSFIKPLVEDYLSVIAGGRVRIQRLARQRLSYVGGMPSLGSRGHVPYGGTAACGSRT